jgi:hypothetical protein
MSAVTYLVLDIETIPDREIFDPPEAQPGAERPFPPLCACKPIVIGVLWLDENLACKRIGAFGDGKDEGAMLADFTEFMTQRRPCIVTWNGRGFDMPVLALRALKYGLSYPWYYGDRDYRYRFSEQGHFDLCDFLADHGAAKMTSLDGAARLIGLTGKDGVDGSQVEGLYHTGQLDAIRQYCLSDVAQTAFLFLRWRLLAGKLDRQTYRRVATDLLAACEADGRLARFAAQVDRGRLLLGA